MGLVTGAPMAQGLPPAQSGGSWGLAHGGPTLPSCPSPAGLRGSVVLPASSTTQGSPLLSSQSPGFTMPAMDFPLLYGRPGCLSLHFCGFIHLFICNQEWLYKWQRNSPGCGDGAQGLSLAWTLAPAKCAQRPAAARHPHWHTEGNPHWLFDRRGPGLVFGADPGTEMTHLPGFPSPGAMEGAFVSQEGPDCWGAVWHRCRNPACPGTSQ